MCKTRNSKKIFGTKIKIDSCMKKLVGLMRMHGIKTLGCCCGHGKYPMTIVIERYGLIEEVISGKEIPRKKEFYKMDCEGFYYIPETIKGV